MLERMVLDAHSNDKRVRPVRPLIEAQVLELQRRYADYRSDTSVPVPGDLVVEKDGMGTLTNEARKDVVLILWRTLDEHDWQDREIIKDWISDYRVNRVDCVLAHVDDDGGALRFVLHELARLRKRVETDGQNTDSESVVDRT